MGGNKARIEDYLKHNLKKHQDFLYSGKTNLLFFTEQCANMTYDSSYEYNIEGQPLVLTKGFVKKNAYELGIQTMKRVQGAAAYHATVGDDWHPFANLFGWGFGVTANLISGKEDIVFEEGTSYATGPVIKDWDDLGKLSLDLDNYWITQVRKYWEGVASAYDMEGIAVLPFANRSPLDFANDLRGNDIYMDLYDHPEEVEALLWYCTKCIIEIDRHLREEIPLLRTAPGGGWGVAFGRQTILLNADPVDLISLDMGLRFNNPNVEKLAEYAAVFFHHHSIGYRHANNISQIKGLGLQEILQDPNGVNLEDVIDDQLIEASRRVPIYFDLKLLAKPNYEEILEKLSEGRFIVSLTKGDVRFSTPDYRWNLSVEEQRDILRSAKKYRKT